MRPKINTNLVDNENDGTKILKKARGIKKSIARNYIMHKEHVDVSIGSKQTKHEINNTVSKSHNINSRSVTKISLSPFDDIKYILDHTVASSVEEMLGFFRIAASSSHFLPF